MSCLNIDPVSSAAVAGLRELILAGERYRQAAAGYLGLDISGSQAVSYLYSRGEMGQTELGNLLGYTTSSITVLIDRLERDNVARRRPHPSDRRRTVVELTDHGRQAVQATGRWLVRSFDHIDPEALPGVIDALSSIAKDLSLQAIDLNSHRNAPAPASKSQADNSETGHG